ncbi:MAG: FAD-dependent oxidoreductase [Spirochaetales bacterium]|nr:FAD-dependent oxidoreductase [Spirochaetales bacterium]
MKKKDVFNEISNLPPFELMGFLSHELKSPLNSIESMLKVIADGFAGDVDPKAMLFVQRAISKTGEARTLITDLLNFQKYTTGEVEKKEIESVSLLASVFRSVQMTASDKNISLSFQIPPNKKVYIEGEYAGIYRAFGNILENAIKYTPESGAVSIHCGISSDAKILRCTIEDTGPGFSDEDKSHLFTPFYRSPLQRGKTPGFGLGLSITKRVIDLHGGTIMVESQKEKGSRFTVELPILRVEVSRDKKQKRILIIGGVTAGPKAAARIRRLDETAEITIIEQSEFLSYAGCGIPSYLSGKVNSPKALMSTSDNTLRDVHFFEFIKNIKILNRTRALHIDCENKEVEVQDLVSKNKSTLPYDTLVLATGAKSVVPGIPGIDGEHVHSLYNIEDAERIKKRFARQHAVDVFIIGGGLIGVETAESLMACGARVTILEKDDHILKLFDPDISAKILSVLSMRGIKTLTNVKVEKISHQDDKSIIITDKGEFHADMIILSTGVKPNAELGVKAGLEIGKAGGIVVDKYLRTSDSSVYAIGDCAESMNLLCGDCRYLPLGSVSTKMGRIAADNIAGKKSVFEGSLGTTMFKVFDVSVARTGLGLAEAKAAGFDAVSVVVSGLDRTHYYQETEYIVLKLVADRKTKRLLGAQGYGRGDCVSRIEILAVAMTKKMTLHDIFLLDLGYYPAFNNPIDILQTACVVLENKLEGVLATIEQMEFESACKTCTVIDVSPAAEFAFAAISGSVNIPLENLRSMSIPYAQESPIILYSKTSSRAYEAYRYLVAQGFTGCRVLEGGYVFFQKG